MYIKLMPFKDFVSCVFPYLIWLMYSTLITQVLDRPARVIISFISFHSPQLYSFVVFYTHPACKQCSTTGLYSCTYIVCVTFTL